MEWVKKKNKKSTHFYTILFYSSPPLFLSLSLYARAFIGADYLLASDVLLRIAHTLIACAR